MSIIIHDNKFKDLNIVFSHIDQATAFRGSRGTEGAEGGRSVIQREYSTEGAEGGRSVKTIKLSKKVPQKLLKFQMQFILG